MGGGVWLVLPLFNKQLLNQNENNLVSNIKWNIFDQILASSIFRINFMLLYYMLDWMFIV